ncbi:unnamed protein product [Dibothriocephalus latus]|uniref:Reverse transcriptase domain-containing protein n=1 Tax=Dibothriocephalus latus TaxID=60516 RepID=A0A3P6TBJ7_DIBLA|nr:unnamed protein product [Dibothriocephalus latus]
MQLQYVRSSTDNSALILLLISQKQDLAFSPDIFRAELLHLKPVKSPGPDNIPALALRELANELCNSLAAIFQRSFEEGVHPEEWEWANVTPIYMGVLRLDCAN